MRRTEGTEGAPFRSRWLKAPPGPGVDPSFWMLPESPGAAERSCDGANCSDGVWPIWGDVVIASLRTEPNVVLSGVNYATPGTPELLQAHDVTKHTFAATADDYHTYRLDWGPQRMDWFVDGVPVKSVDLTDAAIYHPNGKNPFQRAFHLKLSLAVGGLAGSPMPDDFPQARPRCHPICHVQVWISPNLPQCSSRAWPS